MAEDSRPYYEVLMEQRKMATDAIRQREQYEAEKQKAEKDTDE